MEISIIIVNWNSGPLLGDCLRSIRSFGSKHVGSVVVVDNGSTDDSLEGIEQLCVHDLAIIRNAQNVGFARACNQGARLATTPYLLFLNPDARLLDSTLAAAREQLSSTQWPFVGIVGAQLLDSGNRVSRSCSRHPTAIGIISRSLGVDRIFRSQSHFLLQWDHSETRIVDQVIGACYLVRTDVFAQLGGFDERFFVYFEEVDFAIRASQQGWKTVYCAEATAFHLGGGTSRQAKPQRLFYSLRSRLLYARKHFGSLGYMAAAFATLCIEPGSRLVFACLRRDSANVVETRDAYRWLWHWFLTGCKQNGAISPPR